MSTGHVLRSSIFRKQIVAITGLAMVGFVIMHLAGNTLVLFGPEAFNGYAEVLHTLPELLWVARLGLITALALHVYFIIKLVGENRASGGGGRYAVEKSRRGDIAVARKFMVLSGVIVLSFLCWHLWDFTISDKSGARAEINGEDFGLYGVVWNAFKSPVRDIFYIVAVLCVGMHLTHGIQSLVQTLGINHERWSPLINKASIGLGAAVALGFAFLPIYMFFVGAPH